MQTGDQSRPIDAQPNPVQRRRLKRVVQAVGFLVGLALLWWCLRSAFAPENREQIERLADASPSEIAILLALSAITLVINGLLFWITLRPVRRIRPIDHVATNSIATFLGFLPFKLGALARVAMNNRRDGVPLVTIGAWYGSMLIPIVLAYAPAMGASLWRGGLDPIWWLVSLLGATIGVVLVVSVARPFAGATGLARLHRWMDHSPIPVVARLARTDHFTRLHTAADMNASPGSVAAATALRLVDLGVMSTRFVVAASILGVVIGWEEAVLIASTYYLLSIVSPFGVLGSRETGTVWMAGALGLGAASGQSAQEVASSLTVLALFITGTEAIVLLAGAGAGLIWLRPDRLLRKPASRRE